MRCGHNREGGGGRVNTPVIMTIITTPSRCTKPLCVHIEANYTVIYHVLHGYQWCRDFLKVNSHIPPGKCMWLPGSCLSDGVWHPLILTLHIESTSDYKHILEEPCEHSLPLLCPGHPRTVLDIPPLPCMYTWDLMPCAIVLWPYWVRNCLKTLFCTRCTAHTTHTTHTWHCICTFIHTTV